VEGNVDHTETERRVNHYLMVMDDYQVGNKIDWAFIRYETASEPVNADMPTSRGFQTFEEFLVPTSMSKLFR